MTINTQNYEAFLLDFIEGSLSVHEQELLKQFIIQHPELGSWEELCELGPVLVTETIEFPQKHQLKQSASTNQTGINAQNYTEYFIAWYEHLLSEKDQKKMIAFLETRTDLQTEFELYGATYLQPNHNIHFPDKKALYQKYLFITPVFWKSIAVAASIVLLLSSVWFWMQSDRIQNSSTVLREIAEIVPEKNDIEASESIVSEVEVKISPEKVKTAQVKEPVSIQSEPVIRRFAVLPAVKMYPTKQSLSSKGTHTSKLIENRSLSDQLLLASVIAGEITVADAPSQSALKRILDNSVKKTLAIFKPAQEQTNQNSSPAIETKGFSFWDLAASGVKTYNNLTDNEVQLVQVLDSEGKLLNVTFVSDKLSFNKNLNAPTKN